MAEKAPQTPSAEDLVPGWRSSKDVVGELDHSVQKASEKEPDAKPVADADKQAGGGATGGVNDPPLRTNRPGVAIASHLASGAGEHLPTRDPDIGVDGRLSPAKIAEASRK